MQEIAREIRNIVDEVTELLYHIDPGEVSVKENPESWSKKEILGHLIDSVANNHQRFVRASSDPLTVTFHIYNQTDWIRVQHYNESEWDSLIKLWSSYNHHLSHVIEHIPPEALVALCNIGKDEPVTLEFVIRDYLRHLNHHLVDLLKKGT